jgi:hypothetical protein
MLLYLQTHRDVDIPGERVIEAAGKLTDVIFGGRVLWGPSLEVIAGKK